MMTLTDAMSKDFCSAAPSMIHETLVIWHRSSATGPATAKQAAETDPACTFASAKRSVMTDSNVGWPEVP